MGSLLGNQMGDPIVHHLNSEKIKSNCIIARDFIRIFTPCEKITKANFCQKGSQGKKGLSRPLS